MDPSMEGSKGPWIMGVTWLFVIMAIIVTSLRLFVRMKWNDGIFVEDWLMFFALGCQIATQGILTNAYTYGMGKHDIYLSVDQEIEILKMAWIFTTPAIVASILARISICLLMVKIFSTRKWFLIFVWIMTILQTIAGLLIIIFIWAQCSRPEALWNPFLTMSGAAHCWKPSIEQDTAYIAQSLFSFSDLTFVLFPVIFVWKLNMTLRKKLSLMAVLSLGIFTMCASILKAITSQSSASAHDAQWHAVDALFWSSLEQSFVITMGSIPPLLALKELEFKTLHRLGASLRSLIRTSHRSSPDATYTAGGSSGAERLPSDVEAGTFKNPNHNGNGINVVKTVDIRMEEFR